MIRVAPIALLLLVVAAGFGGGTSPLPTGSCRVHMTGTDYSGNRYSQTLDTAMPDGSVVVGSSYTEGNSEIVHLRRVLPDCRIASSFGAIIPGANADVDTIAGTPDGRILLGGSEGRHALVGRFFADGGLDRSFGTEGWTRLRPQENRIYGLPRFFGVTSIAVAPSGTIVVGGTDGGAHCCVRSFVGELTADGTPIAAFGRGGSIVIPNYAGSDAATVFPNPDGSVYVLDQYQGSGCGGPTVTRVFTDGSLDSHFAKAMLQTTKRIQGRHMLFKPSLVPDGRGGFALVGGFDRTCGLFRHWASSGLAVRVGPSGQVAGGRTHFYSRQYALDSPAAIRLPSGSVVVAGHGVTSVLVQVFAPDGSRDNALGDHGLFRVGIPQRYSGDFGSLDLLPRAGASAWLVAGLPHEIDLTPIPVR